MRNVVIQYTSAAAIRPEFFVKKIYMSNNEDRATIIYTNVSSGLKDAIDALLDEFEVDSLLIQEYDDIRIFGKSGGVMTIYKYDDLLEGAQGLIDDILQEMDNYFNPI